MQEKTNLEKFGIFFIFILIIIGFALLVYFITDQIDKSKTKVVYNSFTYIEKEKNISTVIEKNISINPKWLDNCIQVENKQGEKYLNCEKNGVMKNE